MWQDSRLLSNTTLKTLSSVRWHSLKPLIRDETCIIICYLSHLLLAGPSFLLGQDWKGQLFSPQHCCHSQERRGGLIQLRSTYSFTFSCNFNCIFCLLLGCSQESGICLIQLQRFYIVSFSWNFNCIVCLFDGRRFNSAGSARISAMSYYQKQQIW